MKKLQEAILQEMLRMESEMIFGKLPPPKNSAQELKMWKTVWGKVSSKEEEEEEELKATPENTVWTMKSGKQIKVCFMSTSHLYNALKLTVKKYLEGDKIGKKFIPVLIMELAKPERDGELTDEMLEKLAEIEHTVRHKLN